MKSLDEIRSLYAQRKNAQQPAIARMIEVRDAYNGDMVVPLPEMDSNERTAAANLVMSTIDQTGMRVGSVMPAMQFPALRPNIKLSEKRAQKRKDVVGGWHVDNKMVLKLRRRARYLLAYGLTPVQIYPGLDGQPVWKLYDPLTSYPAPCADADEIVPSDHISTFKKTKDWLVGRYPEQMHRLKRADASQTFMVMEYIDSEQCVTFVCGDTESAQSGGYGYSGSTPYEVLHQYENRTGRPLVACPSRITLDRNLGAYDGMIGILQLQAKVLALSVVGMQRGIFPETWAVSNSGGVNIVRHADPMKGVVGLIENGDLRQIQTQPSQMAGVMADRLAGEARMEGSAPAEFGGVSSTNIRTGRRGEQVMAASVDFFIQEAHVLFEQSLQEENKMAIAVVKAWSPRKSFSMYVEGSGQIVYTPTVDFETDTHFVRYPYAGADANGLTIRTGQAIGLETMSRRRAMELDSLILDPEAESDRIDYEALKKAFMTMLQTMAADPNSPLLPSDLAKIMHMIATDKADPWDAYTQVHEAAQKRQAEAAQAQQTPPGPDGQQPGLDVPAGARPEVQPSVGDIGKGVGNLAQMFTQLRRPQQALPQERAPVG